MNATPTGGAPRRPADTARSIAWPDYDANLRLALICVVGATWGAIPFVNFHYGWVATDRYPGRTFR